MQTLSRLLFLASAFSIGWKAVSGKNVYNPPEVSDDEFVCQTDARSDECLAKIESVQCDAENINDAEVDPTRRWDTAQCDALWTNVTEWYKAEHDGDSLAFARWINNKFHGTDNMDCQTLSDSNGCHDYSLCQDLEYTGSFLILNSFVTINRLLWNYYDGLYNSKSDIESIVPEISKNFAPMADTLSTAQIIDFVLMAYSLAAVPAFNAGTKTSPLFKSDNDGADPNGLLKDTVNSLVSNSLTLTKDTTRKEATDIATDQLGEWLGQTIEIWARSTSEYAKQLFAGDDRGIGLLTRLLTDGSMSATPSDSDSHDAMSAEGIKEMVKKALYADLIPRAWRLSNLPIGPFIYKTDADCDADKIEYISKESREKYGFCIDGKMFILTSAPDPTKYCKDNGETLQAECLDDFHDLPGADLLDGSNFSGLTVEDIVVGSVATWNFNDQVNKGREAIDNDDGQIKQDMEAYSDPNGDWPEDSLFERIRNNEVRAAGVMDIPVCDLDEALGNWVEGGTGTKNQVNFKPWSNYPCNNPE